MTPARHRLDPLAAGREAADTYAFLLWQLRGLAAAVRAVRCYGARRPQFA